MSTGRKYTTEDYDLIEQFVTEGLTAEQIGLKLAPPVSSNALRCAASRAGIRLVPRGRRAKIQKFSLTEDQIEALRALLGLVHYDDLAMSWLAVLPIEFRSRGDQ